MTLPHDAASPGQTAATLVRVLVPACVLFGLLPIADATHGEGCVPTQADPSTVNVVDLTGVGSDVFYIEERGNPLGTQPPVPLTGYLLGQGTFVYRETNGLAGMQRGGIGIGQPCFPPPPLPSVVCEEDPLFDENCGHGPDSTLILMY